MPELKDLNPKQIQAATHVTGPCIVVAGAGSGKTATLMKRIQYLVNKGYRPEKILASTFTQKAAQEMRSRVQQELGVEVGKKVYISTLHSLAYQMIMPRLGMGGEKWEVLNDSLYIWESVFGSKSEFNKHALGPIMKIEDAKTAVEKFKADGVRPENIDGQIGEVYHAYETIKRERKKVDFEDLITESVRLFHEDEAFARQWRNRWQFVMIDEFQDVNLNQWHFLLELVKEHKNLLCVGDDKQSIYGFRNARPELMKEFMHVFTNAKLIKLIMNYRSNEAIVDLSNTVINLNRGYHIDMKAMSFNGESDNFITDLIQVKTDIEEAKWVAREIQRLKHKYPNIPYSEYAILYRTNVQSRLFEEALAVENIPYKINGDKHFYESKTVKIILDYLRTTLYQSDPSLWGPLLNKPWRYIPSAVVEEMKAKGWDALLTNYKCQGFLTVIQKLSQFENPGEAIEWLVKSQDGLIKQQEENELVGWVQSLITSAKRYQTVVEFLRFVDWVVKKSKEPQGDEVQLMTIHRSKGLEFETVFVAGCVEKLLPYARSVEDYEIREETRIAYVAMTRAKENLYLTAAERYGETDFELSRYVKVLQA